MTAMFNYLISCSDGLMDHYSPDITYALHKSLDRDLSPSFGKPKVIQARCMPYWRITIFFWKATSIIIRTLRIQKKKQRASYKSSHIERHLLTQTINGSVLTIERSHRLASEMFTQNGSVLSSLWILFTTKEDKGQVKRKSDRDEGKVS